MWVAVYLRRVQGEGAYATQARKGSPEAGAIFILIDRLDGGCDLYGPAPQLVYEEGVVDERRFERLIERGAHSEITERLSREEKLDPDFWVVEVEDRSGRNFLGESLAQP